MCWLFRSDLSLLKIENWSEEFTVFQVESGKTHFLNEMGMKILFVLNQSPMTLAVLCQQLSEYFTLSSDAEFSKQIAQTLLRYEALGLVSKVQQNT